MSVAQDTRVMSKFFSPTRGSTRLYESENADRLGQVLRNGIRTKSKSDDLIVQHYRLAFYVAYQFIGSGVSFDDLVAEAMYGLCLAAKKYDPAQGAYSTYAVIVCRRQLHELVRAHRTTRGKTIADQKVLPTYYRAVNSWVARYGRAPTVEEISSLLSMSQHRVRMLQVADQNTVGSLTQIGNVLSGPDAPAMNTPTPEQELSLKQYLRFIDMVREDVYRRVQASNWTELDKQIFCLRWRLGEPGLRHRTTVEIGRQLGLTKSRVSQVLKRCWSRIARLGVHDCVSVTWLATLPSQVEVIVCTVGVATATEIFGPEHLWESNKQ